MTTQPQEQVLLPSSEREQDALHSRPGGLARDSIAYFLSKLIPGFFGFATLPVLIRLIGVDQYGRLAVLLPLLMAFGGAGTGWLTQGMLRFHPPSTGDRAAQGGFDRAVTLGTLFSILATGAVLFGLLFWLGYGAITVLIGTGLCCSFLAYSVALTQLQAELRPAAVMKREVLRSTAGFAFPVLLVLVPGFRNFQMALLGLALAYLLMALLSIRARDVLKTPVRLYRTTEKSPLLRKLWRFGWAVGVWLLLFQILPLIDRSIIQRFAGYQQAGIYASLYEISVRSFSLLAFPLTQAAHPRIMRHCNEGNYSEAHGIIKSSIRYQLLIFVPIILMVLVFARRIAFLILGFEAPGAAATLTLLITGGFFWQLALLAHKPLEMRGQTRAMLSGMAAVVIVKLAANRLLIPRYGYLASAYVVVGCSLLYLTIVFCLGRAGDPVRREPDELENKYEVQCA